jgi:hypothetical protein
MLRIALPDFRKLDIEAFLDKYEAHHQRLAMLPDNDVPYRE